MKLNSLQPASGHKKNAKRRGRGIGSGLGKTGGRGHKGQKSRSGGFHKVGFEGGQMPLQRRLPKVGFRSRIARFVAEVRLHELAKVEGNEVSLESLKKANLIPKHIKRAKIICSGEITSKVTIQAAGISVTPGARKAIEAAGGKIEA